MKAFACACGSRLFFDNTECLNCKAQVGFWSGELSLLVLDRKDDATGDAFVRCRNYGQGLCNWLRAVDDPNELCLACRLNVESPPTGDATALLRNVEKAKRRLIFGLLALGLPVVPKSEHPSGVGFALRGGTPEAPVTTGHADGLITLDLNEADPAKREATRAALGEDYRTLLGHFRHEIGHYYWTLFFQDEGSLARFRQLFGDERASYSDALRAHYSTPKTDFQNTHISAYATAHPWEDWAETWAHYLHVLDSWETAIAFGLRADGEHGAPGPTGSFVAFLSAWSELMIALNAMNRSMGHDDAYPFSLAPEVQAKLAYVDEMVRGSVGRLRAWFVAVAPASPAPAGGP